ncbi:MAG: CCA tRNA nucleotidyltransferase [Acidobacteriaceae bacterium]
MADYIYLLENRLSSGQQLALQTVRDVARAKGLNIFLTGGAVRDLTTGSRVRDLDVSVEGNALKLKKDLEKAGGVLFGEHDPSQTLFFKFPGSVRLEVSSTRTESFPKPGKPVYHPSDLKQDLYRRDFTANAMALSLNEGSYGLLIDPMNGIADIENRHLRLVSNYGFIEDPARLVRVVRFAARLGWQMDEKTRARYETAKEENYISALTEYGRGYELQELANEEDALTSLKALEAEGWMEHLFPAWTSSKVNAVGLDELHHKLVRLQMQGIHPDASAANFHLLTAKLQPKEVAELKKTFPRQGFVKEIESLDNEAKEFARLLTDKEAAAPSATWKLLTSYKPEPILWLAYSSKSAAIQTKFENFFSVWPEAKQKIPYTLMQEMRITPDLPEYQDLLTKLFFEFMDGKLQTLEAQKAFLEPYSPPAPPPPVHVRRPRAVKKTEPRISKRKQAKAAEEKTAEAPFEAAATPEVKTPAKSDAKAKKVLPAQAAPAKKIEAKKPLAKKPEAKAKPVAKKPAPAKKPAKVAVKPAPVAKKKAAAPVKTVKKAAPAKQARKPAAKKPMPKPVAKKAPAKKPAPKAKPVTKSKPKPAAKKATKPAAKKVVAKKKR